MLLMGVARQLYEVPSLRGQVVLQLPNRQGVHAAPVAGAAIPADCALHAPHIRSTLSRGGVSGGGLRPRATTFGGGSSVSGLSSSYGTKQMIGKGGCHVPTCHLDHSSTMNRVWRPEFRSAHATLYAPCSCCRQCVCGYDLHVCYPQVLV